MAFKAIGAFGCLLPLVPAGTLAAQPTEVRLRPETPWVVERTADRCQVARKFSDGGKPVLLSMRAYAPGYNFEITTAGEPLRFLQSAKTVTIAYGAQEPRVITGTLRGKNKDYGPALIFSQVITGLGVRTDFAPLPRCPILRSKPKPIG